LLKRKTVDKEVNLMKKIRILLIKRGNKMSKSKKLIGGILSAAVALSACSTKKEIVVQEEPTFSDDEISTSPQHTLMKKLR
jgi:hypothetical protein